MTRIKVDAIAAILLLAVLCGCATSPAARRDKFLARGKSSLQQHEYSRAILEFRNAAQAMPQDAEPYYQIGVATEETGDLRTAISFYRKALQQDPKHSGAQLKLARIMAGASEKKWLQDAESRLIALKRASPGSSEVLDTLAVAQLKLGETDQAAENLKQSLASAPADLKSSILLAQTKLSQHDPKTAEKILLQACASDPKSAEPRVALGQLYLAQGAKDQAEAEFQRALGIDSKSSSALIQLANLQLSEGRKQEAEQSFKRLAGSGDPHYKPVHAQFLFEQGRRDEAVHEFEQLAKAEPDNRLARSHLIKAYQAVHRDKDAQALLDNALKNNPKDLDALLERSQIFLACAKYGPAEADLNQVLYLRPNSAEAHYARAQLYRARGEALLYRQDLAEALRLSPGLLQARLDLSQSLIAAKQPGAALEVLDGAPSHQRQLTAVIVDRNWALWASGDLARMHTEVDRGLQQEKSPDLLLQDALWKLKTGNAAGARTSLEQALSLNGGDLRALSALNASYVALKQPALALKAIQDYAAREKGSPYVQAFLGSLLWKNGDHAGARAAFEAAKAADPKYLGADFSLAQIDAHEGKWEDAAARMRNVLAQNDQLVTAHLWMGDIAFSKGNYETAMQEFKRVVDITPDNAEALNNLAYLLADYKKDPDAAMKLAQKAVEISPDDPNYLDTLGWILYERNLYSPAIPYLERAVAKGDNPSLKYHLAMAYAKAGSSRNARDTLALALKSNPDAPEAKLATTIVGRAN